MTKKIILNQLKTQEIYLVTVHNPFDKMLRRVANTNTH